MDASIDDVHREYSARAQARRALEARFEAIHRRFSAARLAVFTVGLVVLILAAWAKTISGLWLIPPLLAFVVLAVRHEDVVRSRNRARRAAEHYERGLARLEDRWSGIGPTGDRFLHAEHPYAIDLDLFGEGSLFQLVSRARTTAGEEKLASWFLAPSATEIVRRRQEAVRELAPALDLREEIAVLGAEVEAGVHPQELVEWSSIDRQGSLQPDRWIALAFATIGAIALLGWIAWHWGSLPLLATIGVQVLLRRRWKEAMRRARLGADHAMRDLNLLAEILECLERSDPHAPLLRELHARLEAEHAPARAIRQLDRLVNGFEARRNALLAPFTFLLLIDAQFGLAIEAWRRRRGAGIQGWLEAVSEFEALSSLAAFGYENPDAAYPEIAASPCFEAVGIGHPLLPRAACVRNDLRLDAEGRLLVVSGSNMSGKSTLLRTVGLSTVLALAGAPVRATRLAVSELSVGASIRIVDSLQQGTSRFYAEIKRVRQIVELAEGGRPLLYLVDEIFQGTNSHDRRIGVEAILRTLVERGALGLITTHDLALTEIVERLGSSAQNVHFEDHLEAGRMVFDFRLREGVVAKSNALELMRSVGLKV